MLNEVKDVLRGIKHSWEDKAKKRSAAETRIQNITKENESIYMKVRYDYIRYYEELPLDDKLVLLESQHGTEINGNIFYILRYLSKNPEYQEYKIYLVCRGNKEIEFAEFLKAHGMEDIHLVVLSTDEYFQMLASAKYLVNDNTILPWWIKKEGQVYLNTWHGTPLKYLGRRMEEGFAEIGNAQKNFYAADYLFYPNEYTMEHMIEDYMLENLAKGTCLIGGYPRNEAFFDADSAVRIRKKLGLDGKKVYAYMPTFRGLASKGLTNKGDAFLIYYLCQLDKKLAPDEEFFVNLHPVAQTMLPVDSFQRIRKFPSEYETYEFLNCADVLITDYSSVFFDFSLTRKKIVLFAFDLED